MGIPEISEEEQKKYDNMLKFVEALERNGKRTREDKIFFFLFSLVGIMFAGVLWALYDNLLKFYF